MSQEGKELAGCSIGCLAVTFSGIVGIAVALGVAIWIVRKLGGF